MRALVLAALIALPLPALAQEAERDRDTLTAFLEDNLSSAGRSVVVTGFRGALSSRATVERLTIADDAGIWLTLNGVVLDWNRAAVLGGRISVNELVADEVVIDRPPRPAPGTVPTPEAPGFALPELPVSVEIGRVAAGRIVLGAAVLGQPVEGSLEAALTLSGGEGRAQLAIRRDDAGPEGRIDLTASYANASRMLVVDLAAAEGPGGIAAGLLDLPGQPAADLTIKGSGPLSDFAADVLLATDGQDRLAGRVTLRDRDGAQGFAADLTGDLAPLFLPDYAEFFGPSVRLAAEGLRAPSGRLDVADMVLETRALRLAGAVTLSADGLPERFDITGRLGLADGSPVLLPLAADQRTRVQGADLRLAFDAARGEGWSGAITLRGLDRDDFDADDLRLSGSGRIARPSGAGAVLGATLTLAAEGLRPADPALAQALGDRVTGGATLFWQQGAPGLRLARSELAGDGYAAALRGRVEGLATGFRLAGNLDLRHDDVARLSALAGRPLSGSVALTAQAEGSPLGGDLDLTARIDARDLTLDQPEADRLLAGDSAIALSLRRDDQGTALRDLTVTAGLLRLVAQGRLATAGTDLSADLTLPDLAAVNPALGGGLTARARVSGTPDAYRLTLDGTGQALRAGQPDADRLLRGTSVLSVDLRVAGDSLTLADARLANPQVTVFAQGPLTGPDRRITMEARLADLSLLVPEYPGPVTLSGQVAAAGDDHAVTLRTQGPGQIDLQAEGTLAAALDRVALALRGSAQAALANPFLGSRAVSGLLSLDARLDGPPALSSLSGRIDLTQGRLSDPDLHFSLTGLTARVDLAGSTARIDAGADVSSGGRVTVQGTLGTAPPLPADLAVRLSRVVLRDPALYEARLNGDLRLTGPLAGGATLSGRIDLGETELRIPDALPLGAGLLPDLRHVNEPAAVRATRARAGLLDAGASGGGGGALRLDLLIDAPGRIFVRGRGLDAELGGSVLLRGTTDSIEPAGGLELIRGRLDILGRRLVLTSAGLRMQGDLIPDLEIAAETESDGIVTRVEITGPADAPEVRFTSTPELPQEEVLARLLFGRGLDKISAFQAAQLASAVATLAGRGGEGIVSRLRQGFGLDDLDLVTDGDGNAAVRAGKYLSDNLYTEVEVDQQGKSKVSLNLDLRPGVVVKGSVGSDGQAGIGVFVERDY